MFALGQVYNRFLCLLNAASPAMMLVVRIWIARVFWLSGLVKISDWDTTIYLFTNEHPVPFLSPAVAGVFSVLFELGCPVLLTFGLGARLAAIPLLVMTAVIEFTYLDATEHYYWAMLLGMILFFGPGKWSLDELIARKFGPVQN